MTVQFLTQFVGLEVEKEPVGRPCEVTDKVIRDERGSIDFSYYSQRARNLRAGSQFIFFRKLFRLS